MYILPSATAAHVEKLALRLGSRIHLSLVLDVQHMSCQLHCDINPLRQYSNETVLQMGDYIQEEVRQIAVAAFRCRSEHRPGSRCAEPHEQSGRERPHVH